MTGCFSKKCPLNIWGKRMCLNVQKSPLGISLRCKFSRSGADLKILHFYLSLVMLILLVNWSHFEYEGRGPIHTSTIHLKPRWEYKNQWIEKCEVNSKFSSARLKFRIAACAGLHPFSTGSDPLNSLPYQPHPPARSLPPVHKWKGDYWLLLINCHAGMWIMNFQYSDFFVKSTIFIMLAPDSKGRTWNKHNIVNLLYSNMSIVNKIMASSSITSWQ